MNLRQNQNRAHGSGKNTGDDTKQQKAREIAAYCFLGCSTGTAAWAPGMRNEGLRDVDISCRTKGRRQEEQNNRVSRNDSKWSESEG